jgi:putative ATPase
MSLTTLLRPSTLNDIIGQDHIVGKDGILRRMIDTKYFTNILFWGPPGVGKTSLAIALAKETNSDLIELNATDSSIADLRKAVERAKKNGQNGIKTFVFVDEINHWAKNQQNVLLPVIEDGTIVLFGAMVEKPKFVVNSAVISRCLVVEVKPFSKDDLAKLIIRAIKYYKSIGKDTNITGEAAKRLINRCSGDARKLLLSIEAAVELFAINGDITEYHIDSVIPDKHIVFDKSGNEHYDYASAYQTCIQNSDDDGAIYWLAQWLVSGEDPAYICRRMMVSAFEDAAHNLLLPSVVMSAHYMTERVGPPECYIAMATATIAIAQSRRDKTGYLAIKKAIKDIENNETKFVPDRLRAGSGKYVNSVDKIYIRNDLIEKFVAMIREIPLSK